MGFDWFTMAVSSVRAEGIVISESNVITAYWSFTSDLLWDPGFSTIKIANSLPCD
jgi:hypothetical protein